MSEELEPCPFCGGKARLWPAIMPFDADYDEITVQCADCDAIGANVLVDQGVHDQSDLPSLEAEAIAAWNTRTESETLKRYREALESIAAYSDTRASERLERTGSYGSFDEPGSVEIARQALTGASPND